MAAADADARQKLMDGERILVSQLFPREPLRSSALRSARAIYLKVRELADERGVWAGCLAVGIATWADPYAARRPAVPVLLRRYSMEPTDATHSDFRLQVSLDAEVNPVLLLAMATHVGVRLEPDDLLDQDGRLRYAYVVDRLREFAPAHVVDGFAIAHRAVLATFTDAVLTTAAALRSDAEQLAASDLVAMLAGVDVSAPRVHESTPRAPLGLDLDDAQSALAQAVVAGGSRAAVAPPGTGVTQTLAAAVGALVAAGKRVLVVSEPRAPLRDLTERLRDLGLQDAVLDLSPETSEAAALADIAEVLDRVGGAAVPEPGAEGGDQQALAELESYLTWLHTPVQPWGLTPYDVYAATLAGPSSGGVSAMLPADAVRRLHGAARDRARADLGALVDAGGLTAASAESPWNDALLDDEGSARRALEAATSLHRQSLGAARDAATRAAIEVGLPAPTTVGEAAQLAQQLAGVHDTLAQFLPEIWTAPLDDLVAATADRHGRAGLASKPGFATRVRARRTARELRLDPRTGPSGAELHRALATARDRLAIWREKARDARPPRLGEHSALAVESVNAAVADLDVLFAALPDAGLVDSGFTDLSQLLGDLLADQAGALRVPKLRSLRSRLADLGLAPLLSELAKAEVDRATAEAAFEHAWHRGVAAAVAAGGQVPQDFAGLVDRFGPADAREVALAALAVRQSYASAVRSALTEHAEQRGVLEGVRARLRSAVVDGPDLVMATKPVWLVAPLRVSTVLPLAPLFDLVVIEAAHRVAPALAVPALARAGRVLVCGDPERGWPTEFSVAADPEPEPEPDPAGAPLRGHPTSILDQLRSRLPASTLSRDYRSVDSRLVAVAADRHGGGLVAWPNTGASRVCLELVTQPVGHDRQEESVEAEAARVIDLVLAHAHTRRDESLAVVTLTERHADRIRTLLRGALMVARDVHPFFRADRPEPFAVVTFDHLAERSRDVVILAVGYGRTAEGRLLYRFGTLGREGGEALLATASAAGRHDLVVASSLSAEDLNERRLLTAGPQALRELLAFAGRGGEPLPGVAASAPLDPLAADIARHLDVAGLTAVAGYGAHGLQVPVAVAHHQRDRSMVLAILPDRDAGSLRQAWRVDPARLRGLGWTVVPVSVARWTVDPAAEVERIKQAYEAASGVALPDTDRRGEPPAA